MEIRRKKNVSNAVGVTGYVFGNHPLSPDTVKIFFRSGTGWSCLKKYILTGKHKNERRTRWNS